MLSVRYRHIRRVFANVTRSQPLPQRRGASNAAASTTPCYDLELLLDLSAPVRVVRVKVHTEAEIAEHRRRHPMWTPPNYPVERGERYTAWDKAVPQLVDELNQSPIFGIRLMDLSVSRARASPHKKHSLV